MSVILKEVEKQLAENAGRKNQPVPQTFHQTLLDLPSSGHDYNELLMSLRYGRHRGDVSFFVRSTPCQFFFRHGGNLAKIPPYVYLRPPSENDCVHVYNQHSGVGKTVELCGSAYLRKAHLTIYHQGNPDYEIQIEEIQPSEKKDAKSKFYEARKKAAQHIIERIIEEAVERNQTVFDALESRASQTTEEEFKLVLAIDEASTCRNLVRAVLQNHVDFGNAAATKFKSLFDDWSLNVKVLFSVAGTGGAPADIGPLPDNYTIIPPLISEAPEKVYDALCVQFKLATVLPSYDELSKKLPILSTFVRYNARFASIVVRVLAAEMQNNMDASEQGPLIRCVVRMFCAWPVFRVDRDVHSV